MRRRGGGVQCCCAAVAADARAELVQYCRAAVLVCLLARMRGGLRIRMTDLSVWKTRRQIAQGMSAAGQQDFKSVPKTEPSGM